MELHHLGFCVRDNLEESVKEWEYLGFEKMVEIGRHPTNNMSIIYMNNGDWRIEMMTPQDPAKESPITKPLAATKAQLMNYHTGFSSDDTSKEMRKLMGEGYQIMSNVTPGWLPCVQHIKISNMTNFEDGLGQYEIMGTSSTEDFVE